MILPPFEGPRLKLRRARKHISDLQQIIEEFGQRVQIQLVKVGQTAHLIDYRLRFTEHPPEEVPAIIGDAIHNLRASLDIMVCDLARLRDKSSDKLKFPFAEDEKKLDAILAKDLARLGPDIVEAIRSRKPYKGGNLALRALHDLDIDDKHETVLPFYLVAWGTVNIPAPVEVMMRQHLGINLGNALMPLSDGVAISVAADIDPRSTMTPLNGAPQPTFPKELPLAGEPIIETLGQLAKIVDEIVEAFAGKFGGRNAKAHVPPSGNGTPV